MGADGKKVEEYVALRIEEKGNGVVRLYQDEANSECFRLHTSELPDARIIEVENCRISIVNDLKWSECKLKEVCAKNSEVTIMDKMINSSYNPEPHMELDKVRIEGGSIHISDLKRIEHYELDGCMLKNSDEQVKEIGSLITRGLEVDGGVGTLDKIKIGKMRLEFQKGKWRFMWLRWCEIDELEILEETRERVVHTYSSNIGSIKVKHISNLKLERGSTREIVAKEGTVSDIIKQGVIADVIYIPPSEENINTEVSEGNITIVKGKENRNIEKIIRRASVFNGRVIVVG